ncbi:TPA: hypothetical protein ACH3X3_008783 [Trebouxia sp. C0006]
MLGKGQGFRSRIDMHQMLGSMFDNVNKMPHALARLDSKPIRMQTAASKVELAVLHVIEAEPSSADMGAMCERNPLHSFMFDAHGKLLNANKATFEAFQSCPPDPVADRHITLKKLFRLGYYPGGQEEALAAYEEAYNDIFNLKLDCHKHPQPHKSRKDGTIKWEMIEMWPMQDPIDASPAVLVKKYDITAQKDLELKLSIQQQKLQRQNQELERYSASVVEDKVRLQEQADSLSQRLEAVLHDKFERKSFDADTPIDKTLAYLQSVIQGSSLPVQAALDLYHILSESGADLRQPIGLKKQLLQTYSLDADVGQSMLQLLQGCGQSEAPFPGSGDAAPGQTEAAGGPLVHRTSSLASASLMPSITPALERQLQDAGSNWQFDIFAFAEETPNNTLSLLAMHCFQQSGVVQHYKLRERHFWRWLQRIESGYVASNPYHNSVHVASVLQMAHMLLTHGGIRQSNAMGMQEVYGTYWSAITHDFEHGGLNNDFLIRTYHPLAICYNDQSPLENHHLAAASRITILEFRHVFGALELAEDAVSLRKQIINMVLGTDMKKHFDIVSRFQAAFKKAPSSGNSTTEIDWAAVKTEDKTLMHQMLLKCADIGHLAADVSTHKRWAYQLEEEFFRQGDKEKACGLTVSPLMDREHAGGMTRSQLGFLNIVGIPLFKAMAELFEGTQPMLDGVLANYRQWEAAAQASEASMK